MLVFGQGQNRLFYRSKSGVTGLAVTFMYIDPNLVKHENIPFDELYDGYYYLDINFQLTGKYVFELRENGEYATSTTAHVGAGPGIVHYNAVT
jgi:hypothetical protein